MDRNDPLPSWRPGSTQDALEALAAGEEVPVGRLIPTRRGRGSTRNSPKYGFHGLTLNLPIMLGFQGFDCGSRVALRSVLRRGRRNGTTKRLLINKRTLIVGACGGSGERDNGERRQ
jgi:hypothetical protein